MIDVGLFRRSGCFPEAWGIPVWSLPGRIAVVMDEVVPGLLVTTDEPCTGVVISSGCDGIDAGDRVIVRKEHGLQMDYRDADWIPRGADVRFYGVAVPVSESVLAVLN